MPKDTGPPSLLGPGLKRLAPWLVGLLTLIGLGLRLYRLEFLSLWIDELVHAQTARAYLEGRLAPVDPGLNGILQTYSVLMSFGVLGVSDFAARLPSVLYGTLCIPAAYLLARRLLNAWIGLCSASLVCLSLVCVHWSRLARMYAAAQLFCLLLLLGFLWAFDKKPVAAGSWLARRGIDGRGLGLLAGAALLAILSHQLSGLLLFGLSAWGTAVLVARWLRRQRPILDRHAFLAGLGVLLAASLFTGPGQSVLRTVAGLLLSEGQLRWLTPDLANVWQALRSPERFDNLRRYLAMLHADQGWLQLLGWAGMLLGLRRRPRATAFLACSFLAPLLLLSFVLRDPCEPRYLTFCYPLFLIAMAWGLHEILLLLAGRLPAAWRDAARLRVLMLAGGLTLLMAAGPWQGVWQLLNTSRHGNVVPIELAHIFFKDWRAACAYVARNLGPDDAILATVPQASDYYLRRDDSIVFRQQTVQPGSGAVQAFGVGPLDGTSAASLQDLQATVRLRPRGWLIGDNFLRTVHVDQPTRVWAEQHLDYHFNAVPSDWFMILSWDRPDLTRKRKLLLQVGQGGQMRSRELKFAVDLSKPNPTVKLRCLVEGLDTADEGYIRLNGQQRINLPAVPAGAFWLDVQLPRAALQAENRLFVAARPGVKGDVRPGFAVYALELKD